VAINPRHLASPPHAAAAEPGAATRRELTRLAPKRDRCSASAPAGTTGAAARSACLAAAGEPLAARAERLRGVLAAAGGSR